MIWVDNILNFELLAKNVYLVSTFYIIYLAIEGFSTDHTQDFSYPYFATHPSCIAHHKVHTQTVLLILRFTHKLYCLS